MAAKKKRVKKKSAKKAVRKKTPAKKSVSRSVSKKASHISSKKVRATGKKITLVSRNLILFIVLSLLSFLLYLVSNNKPLYAEFFRVLSWILGAIALAFFIAFLILIIMKAMRK